VKARPPSSSPLAGIGIAVVASMGEAESQQLAYDFSAAAFYGLE
jgi:hypothetical protein